MCRTHGILLGSPGLELGGDPPAQSALSSGTARLVHELDWVLVERRRYTQVQKSRIAAGIGKGPVNMSVVSTTPTRRCVGIVGPRRAEAAVPPVAADVRARPVRRTCTPTPNPQPCEPSGEGPDPPGRRRSGRWSSPPRTPPTAAGSRPADGRLPAACGRRRARRRPWRPARRQPTGRRAASPTDRRARRRRPWRPSPGPSCSTTRGGRCASVEKPVSTIPSGSSTRSRRNTSSGWPAARAIEHAEHVGAGVVQPSLAGLVQQRQRRQRGASTRRARAASAARAGPQPRPSSPIASSSGCGHGGLEVHAPAELEREDVVHA